MKSQNSESKSSHAAVSPNEVSQPRSPSQVSQQGVQVKSNSREFRQDTNIKNHRVCLSIYLGTHAAHRKSHALTKDLLLSVNPLRHQALAVDERWAVDDGRTWGLFSP